MAVNGFHCSVFSSLWQSRLKECRKITQNQERIAQRRLRRYLRRRRLVSSLFFLFLTRYIFHAFACSSCLDQTKVEVVLGRDVPGLE